MGNISATTLLKYIDTYNENLGKYEQRTPKVGSLDAFRKDTLMIGGGSGIISSSERDGIAMNGYSPNGMAIPVIDNQGITISTSGSSTNAVSPVSVNASQVVEPEVEIVIP